MESYPSPSRSVSPPQFAVHENTARNVVSTDGVAIVRGFPAPSSHPEKVHVRPPTVWGDGAPIERGKLTTELNDAGAPEFDPSCVTKSPKPEGRVSTTKKAMAEKFCEDAAAPGSDGSGNPFAVVEPMADQSGL